MPAKIGGPSKGTMEPKQPLSVRVIISGNFFKGVLVGPFGETQGAPATTPEQAAVNAFKLSWLRSNAARAALVTWHAGAGRTMVALVPTSGELLDVQSPTFTWIEL